MTTSSQFKCTKCKDTGILTFYYNEVMDADGIFYDQNIQYEMRSIRKKCSCQKKVTNE